MTAENQCPCKRVPLPDLEAFQYCPLDCSMKHLFRVTSANDHNGVSRASAPSRNTSHHHVLSFLGVMVRMPANRYPLCLVLISRNVSRPAYFLCSSRALPLDIFKNHSKVHDPGVDDPIKAMDHSIDGDRPRISDDQPPEERNAPREATLLGSFDVFALIVNKMIGTGIYSAPTTVFLLTKNKQVSLGLWAVGFFYTIMRFVALVAVLS
jgi:hypothetical protein